MEEFKNRSESFFRETRYFEIYSAIEVEYIDAFNGTHPDPNKALYVFHIVPETLSRNITTKTRSGNPFTVIDLSFPLLDLSKTTVDKCNDYFNKKDFAIVEVSNVDRVLMGNKREPLRIDVLDNMKKNNSGDDEYTIAISGESILKPKIKNL